MKIQIFNYCLLSLIMLLLGESFGKSEITKGIKGGINYSKFIGDDTNYNGLINPSYEINYAFGIFADFPINDKISIRPEGYYSVKGSEYTEAVNDLTANANFTLNYLDVPVLMVFHLNRKMGLFFGPSMNIYVNGSLESSTNGDHQSENIEDNLVKIPEWALVIGINYFVNNFQIDLRYNFPLSSWPKGSDKEIKISMFQFLVGLSF